MSGLEVLAWAVGTLLGIFCGVGVIELLDWIKRRARRRGAESIMWIKSGRRAK